MKYLIRITLCTLLLLPLLFTTPAAAQDKDEKKVKVKIVTEENGEQKVFERTYQSKEEMKNDPEFQELAKSEDLDIDIDEKRMAFVTESKSDKDGKIEDISIDIESDGEDETIRVKKITKDKHGEETVMEKSYNSWEEAKEDEEMGLSIKELKGDRGIEWSSDEDGETHVIIKKKQDEDVEEYQEHEVEMIIEEEDGKVKKKVKKEN